MYHCDSIVELSVACRIVVIPVSRQSGCQRLDAVDLMSNERKQRPAYANKKMRLARLLDGPGREPNMHQTDG